MRNDGYENVVNNGELTQVTPPLPLPLKGREREGSKHQLNREAVKILSYVRKMNTDKDLQILQKALDKVKEGFLSFPDSLDDEHSGKVEEILIKVAERMQDNFPYFQPNYAGQMLKPPHAIARIAYMLAMYVNPNNHALDGGRASSAMEKEAVAGIAKMFGWTKHLGHLTSGGTMANLEAL